MIIGSTSSAGEAIPPCYSGPTIRGVNFQGTYDGTNFILTTTSIDNSPLVTLTFKPYANKDALTQIEKQVMCYYEEVPGICV